MHERLARFVPPEADLQHDAEAATVYYQQLWQFVSTLGPAFNSLKASVLFQLLSHQRRLGLYDAARLRAYLELPRPTPYLLVERRRAFESARTVWVDWNYRAPAAIPLPPIVNEEPLIREYLIELLKDAPDASAFEEVVESRWLQSLLAESKLLHGLGRPEEWASKLSPDAYRAILERVELQWAPQNPSYWSPGQPVVLRVDVKRIESVHVKIYEIQTFNYYTTKRRAVDETIDLDGLMPAHERTIRTEADPVRRIRHTIELPEIRERGLYVVDLVGGGVHSRAVLHVGRLEAVTLPVATGLALRALNESGESVPDATVWMGGGASTGRTRTG